VEVDYMGGKHWAEEDSIQLRNAYKTVAWEDLLKMFPNRTRRGIKDHALAIGLSKRPRRIRKILDFSRIDSEEKAYILGFIGADGNLTKKGDGLHIVQAEKDHEFLYTIRDILSPSSTIKVYKKSKTCFGGEETKDMHYYRLSVYSQVLYKQLLSHGLKAAKTFTLDLPLSLPERLFSHYVRGYFDGDGSVGFGNKSYKYKSGITKRWKLAEVSVASGSLRVLEIIKEHFNISYECKRNIYKQCSIWRIYLNGKSALDFLEWIYEDSTLALPRKCEISMYALNNCDESGKIYY
jgi:hypothetical protein